MIISEGRIAMIQTTGKADGISNHDMRDQWVAWAETQDVDKAVVSIIYSHSFEEGQRANRLQAIAQQIEMAPLDERTFMVKVLQSTLDSMMHEAHVHGC